MAKISYTLNEKLLEREKLVLSLIKEKMFSLLAIMMI